MSDEHNVKEHAIEKAHDSHLEATHDAHKETLLPYTDLFGRRINLPVYTVVFLTLGVVTIIEVAIAEFFPREFFLTVPLLIVLSLAKAILVVLYYMHLKEDSRIFAVALLLPVFVGFVATFFLLAVPPTGY
jgi:caa(3)-type oxidase subunit IV